MRDKDREFYTELFIKVANLCEPTNPDIPRFTYPMKRKHVWQTWKQSQSSFHASLGRFKIDSIINPNAQEFVKYAVDLDYFNNSTRERVLAITVHEVTHIEEGSHTEGSTHNPNFWNAMIENGKVVLENLEEIEVMLGPINVNNFVEEMVDDPNGSMVDRRVESVDERKNKMFEELKEYKEL